MIDPGPGTPAAPDAAPGAGRRHLTGLARDVLETLLLTLVIFVAMQAFVARVYGVEMASMEGTLEPGQRVVVDELTPRFGGYARGDIVVFQPPAPWDQTLGGQPLIKRVIGVGGDTIMIRDGHVEVNGRMLVEPYVFDGQPTDPSSGRSTWLVPEGELFVLGDHRQASADSRVFGTIPISRVIGRAWLRFLPFDTFGVLSTPVYPDLSPAAK